MITPLSGAPLQRRIGHVKLPKLCKGLRNHPMQSIYSSGGQREPVADEQSGRGPKGELVRGQSSMNYLVEGSRSADALEIRLELMLLSTGLCKPAVPTTPPEHNRILWPHAWLISYSRS